MVILIVGGVGEGKSGTAHWLRAQLKKLGAEATLDDGNINEEQYKLISKNYDLIMASIVAQKKIHIVTKQSGQVTDKSFMKLLSKHDFPTSLGAPEK